jgi:hypothetical protein
MRLTISNEGVFIPSFNKNKELPETDQIRVLYRVPTVAIKNRCIQKPQTKGIASADGRIEHMEILLEKDSVAMLKEMLISISNCSYTDGKHECVITNTQDLINAPVAFEPLLKEIASEFELILAGQGIDEKN